MHKGLLGGVFDTGMNSVRMVTLKAVLAFDQRGYPFNALLDNPTGPSRARPRKNLWHPAEPFPLPGILHFAGVHTRHLTPDHMPSNPIDRRNLRPSDVVLYRTKMHFPHGQGERQSVGNGGLDTLPRPVEGIKPDHTQVAAPLASTGLQGE